MPEAPKRGDIWLVDLSPTRGHEPAGQRPALILSADTYNSGPADLVVVLPITSKNKRIPLQIAISPPKEALRHVASSNAKTYGQYPKIA